MRNGKSWNDISKRKRFLNKIYNRTGCTKPAAKRFKKYKSLEWCPYYIDKLSNAGQGKT